jgi:hypothetical protein
VAGAGAAGSGSLPNNLEKKPRFFGSFSLITRSVASAAQRLVLAPKGGLR